MPTKIKTSKHELIVPNNGDKRFARRSPTELLARPWPLGNPFLPIVARKPKRREPASPFRFWAARANFPDPGSESLLLRFNASGQLVANGPIPPDPLE
jgi:hypothetical protein